MNIHEYQAKDLFEKFNVPSPKGRMAESPDEALKIANEMSGQIVIKAQVHAGGRGKGTFKNGFQGGVHLSNDPNEIHSIAEKMLGQGGPPLQVAARGRSTSAGRKVRLQ